MQPNDTPRWLRAAAGALAALALAATALEVGRKGSGPAVPASFGSEPDPLAAELERCNAITPASARDDACERVWAENRRRFLGVPSQPAANPASITSAPSATGDRP